MKTKDLILDIRNVKAMLASAGMSKVGCEIAREYSSPEPLEEALEVGGVSVLFERGTIDVPYTLMEYRSIEEGGPSWTDRHIKAGDEVTFARVLCEGECYASMVAYKPICKVLVGLAAELEEKKAS